MIRRGANKERAAKGNAATALLDREDQGAASPAIGPNFPGVRSVAVVIAALGTDLGAKVLAHFPAPEVEAIIREVKDMPNVRIEDVRSVLERLRDEALAHSYAVAGGLERARELLRRSHGNAADAILEQIISASAAQPFQFLRSRRPEQIVSYVSSEHPQVIALVLAHLPMGMAAQVVEGLPPSQRAEVAERYAKLEGTDPEVIAEIEMALSRRVGGDTASEPTSNRGGVKPLAQLLNNVGRDTEKGVLSELERSDPALAVAVRDLMFVFEDIAHLDDRGLQEVLRASDTRTIALALKDTLPAVRDKIERNLSQRAGQDVAEFAAALGLVRRSDVEAAQQEIVRGARRLEEEGRIVLMRGSDTGDFIA